MSQSISEMISRRRRLKRASKLDSKCLKGRLKHIFNSPKTRTTTDNDKCWWCGKPFGQVKVERRLAQKKKRLAKLSKEKKQ